MTECGQGVKYEVINGKELVIRIDLTKNYGPSSSGKTLNIATTQGFEKLSDGTMFSLNVNRKE
jgi:hypothetical protein